jgi:hypothetical protein
MRSCGGASDGRRSSAGCSATERHGLPRGAGPSAQTFVHHHIGRAPAAAPVIAGPRFKPSKHRHHCAPRAFAIARPDRVSREALRGQRFAHRAPPSGADHSLSISAGPLSPFCPSCWSTWSARSSDLPGVGACVSSDGVDGADGVGAVSWVRFPPASANAVEPTAPPPAAPRTFPAKRGFAPRAGIR